MRQHMKASDFRARFICMGRPLRGCPEGTTDNSPAFQRWVGNQKVLSPDGTAEFKSHSPPFSRPFGTYVPCAMFPGVKTPGYSQEVPPGQRNVAVACSTKQTTRFISHAFKCISRQRCLARKMCDTSIQGSGRILRCLSAKPSAMSGRRTPRTIQPAAGCSLSLRERVRVNI